MSLLTGWRSRTRLGEGMFIDWFDAIDEVTRLLLDGVFTTSLDRVLVKVTKLFAISDLDEVSKWTTNSVYCFR